VACGTWRLGCADHCGSVLSVVIRPFLFAARLVTAGSRSERRVRWHPDDAGASEQDSHGGLFKKLSLHEER
jgi:hypothetical protein